MKVERSNGYVHLLCDKFRQTLIHDMTETQFADMYAQTVVYGLFSARCMDETQEDFSVEEAVECIPNTNPFLKDLMRDCLGSTFSKNMQFDELDIGNVVDLLAHTNTAAIIRDFNRQTGGGREDPVIHFYEEFLTAYDKEQKVQRGVYYTPQPVVNFMVRAVDDILKNEFGLKDGLASTTTKKVKQTVEKLDSYGRVKGTKEVIADVPAVQVLDPATGTGTFLRQTILQIYENFRQNHKGESEEQIKKAWNEYVPEHLLPRINGFELMMAPYAVAHMKLAMVLKDTGYDFATKTRLNVCLTNTLEPAGNTSSQTTMFDDPLAMESIEASRVKSNSGINILIGNPPYNFSSTNRGEWILTLLSQYKEGLNERKIHLDDDYVKFIRFAQYFADNSKFAIMAYITNNSFIDGVTHRVMRKTLLQSYDKIYILNLHGNSKKGESDIYGGKDENVFDIQQGVSINIMIKTPNHMINYANVFHYDLVGTRAYKYKFLFEQSFNSCLWKPIIPVSPSFFLIPKDFSENEEYSKGVAINNAFNVFSQGILSGNDACVMYRSRHEATENISRLLSVGSAYEAETIFYEGKAPTKNWSFSDAYKDIKTGYIIEKIQYRPFEQTYTAYTETSCGWLWRPRSEVMKHMLESKENLCLITTRAIQKGTEYHHAFVADCISDKGMLSSKDNSYVLPLYTFSHEFDHIERRTNLSKATITGFEEATGLQFSDETAPSPNTTISSVDIFAYIYAVLYSPSYRKKYREFLIVDFAKIPYPVDCDSFYALSKLGMKLISIHLLREKLPMEKFVVQGNNFVVEKIEYKDRNVYINENTYIQGVDESVWNFVIGSYQVASHWLKGHKKQVLTMDEIECFKKTLTVIEETQRIMKEIDELIIL